MPTTDIGMWPSLALKNIPRLLDIEMEYLARPSLGIEEGRGVMISECGHSVEN